MNDDIIVLGAPQSVGVEQEFCTRCEAKLKIVVWLEFDQRTNTYTDKEIPDEFNQGAFPFGTDCAKKEIAQAGERMHNGNN